MNVRILKRNLQIHQVLSSSLSHHFLRLWGRGLSDQEQETIENATVCLSFMRLELLERSLELAQDRSVANEEFAFISASVDEGRAEVLAALAGIPGVSKQLIEAGARGSLLRLEQALCDVL
jgi:hypothetical protein